MNKKLQNKVKRFHDYDLVLAVRKAANAITSTVFNGLREFYQSTNPVYEVRFHNAKGRVTVEELIEECILNKTDVLIEVSVVRDGRDWEKFRIIYKTFTDTGNFFMAHEVIKANKNLPYKTVYRKLLSAKLNEIYKRKMRDIKCPE